MKLSKSKIPRRLVRSGKKTKSWKKAIAVGAISASLGLGFWASKAFYTVKEVIDGDTFVTQDNIRVRLDNVDAPEIGLCLSTEAKKELESLILNKKIFIKSRYIDKFGRMNATVYTTNGSINEKMLASGMATYLTTGLPDSKYLKSIQNNAKDAKLGIFSSICTQETNSVKPNCSIKGNIRQGQNYYRYPGCDQYKTTIIQLYQGDKWFCTEKEALKDGFTKGSDCP